MPCARMDARSRTQRHKSPRQQADRARMVMVESNRIRSNPGNRIHPSLKEMSELNATPDTKVRVMASSPDQPNGGYYR